MRKLATAALAYSAAVALAVYLFPAAWLLPMAAGLGLLAAIVAFWKGSARLRLLLILIPAAIGLCWCRGYDALVIAPADQLVGDHQVTGVVLDYSTEYDGYSYVYVRISGADGKPVRARIASYDGGTASLRPGDLIQAEVRFSRADTRYGEETDIYFAKGTLLLGTFRTTPEVVGRSGMAWTYFPKEIARAMKISVDRSMPADTAGLLKALLTGDRQDLYEDYELYAAMQRAGITHIVAISGMHVAFIVGFVRQFTGRRRKTALICIPLILVFIPMTGGSASVVRAGFMQICLLLAPLLRRENDSITSLSAVLALLLLINPYAVTGAGLQLSFAAMAGILLVTPRVYDGLLSAADGIPLLGGKLRRKAVHFLAASISSTIGAMVFTTPLLALHFGCVQLYSAVTNLLTLGILSLCFMLGYGVCLLGLLWPVLGISAGWVLAWPLRLVMLLVGWVADWPYAMLYTANNTAAWWLIFVYVLFIVTYLRKGTGAYRPVLPVSLSVCTLCLVLFLTGLEADRSSGVTVLDVGQGQSVAIYAGRRTVLVDCGGMSTLENAGETAAAYLQSNGRQKVDLLVLTHFHRDHAGGVTRLLAHMEVERLAIPRDVDDADGLLPEILDAANRHGVEVCYIDENSTVEMGGLSLRIFAPIGANSVNESGLIVLASIGDFDVLITGDVSSTIERRLLYRETLPDIEVLVAGHHGSRQSTSAELLEATKPEAVVISVGYNSYGHPAEETLERLRAAGAAIYRTDLDGAVSIRPG